MQFLSHGINREATGLKQALRNDKKKFIEEVTEKAASLNVSEIYKELRPLIGTKKTRQRVRPVPSIRKENGELTKSREEYDRRWTEYFAAMEAGEEIDIDTFLEQTFLQQAEQELPSTWSPQELPQLAWLERAAQQIRRGKAPGFDQIPGEVFKAHPGHTARAMLPLLWKFTLKFQEAVGNKGGKLTTLYKHKGDMKDCTNYRSILLMAASGKLLRSATRPLINAPYSRGSQPLQLAGKKGSLVTFGSQAVKSFLNIHRQRNQTAAVIFGDVRSAFYLTLRQLTVGATCCYEDAAKLAQRFGLSEEVMGLLHKALNGEAAQQNLGSTEMQTGLLKQALSGTWFAQREDCLIATKRGSRPGDSWADVCFNVLFTEVVKQIVAELQMEGLCLTLPAPEVLCPYKLTTSATMLDLAHVTWADDIAVLVSIKEANLAAQATAKAARSLLEALNRRGMEASIGEGKTAALLLPRGKQAVKMRRQIFQQAKATIPILMEHACVDIPLISQYRHLGGEITARGGYLPDMKSKLARAKSAFWRLSKVFKSPLIKMGKKVILFQSTTLSIWTWGIGSWSWLSSKEYDFFVKATWGLYRLLLPPRFHPDGKIERWTNSEIQQQLNLPDPEGLLQEARLRNIGHMLKAAPLEVWALHVHDQEARRSSLSALKWFWTFMHNDCGLPHYDDWQPWIDSLQQRPQRWKALVKQATLRALRHQQLSFAVQKWHWRIYNEIIQVMPRVDAPPTAQVLPGELCLPCNRAFCSRKAWFLHANQCHGYQTAHGRAAAGRYCWVCAKLYNSHLSLVHHLRYSPRCCTYFLMHVEQPPHESPAQHPQMPWRPLACSGEMAPQSVDFEAEALQEKIMVTWQEVWKADAPPSDLNDTVSRINLTLQCVLPFVKIQLAFDAWQQRTSEDLPVLHLPWFGAMVGEIHRWFQQMVEIAGGMTEGADASWSSMATEEGRATFRPGQIHPKRWSVHPREAFYLHFFSGRRRQGDLQTMLEQCEVPAGMLMFVVSLDVTICPRRCDLRQPEQQQRWVRLIISHRVLGVTSGPPCESWSRARGQAVADCHGKAPRPVRHQQTPWGRPAISLKEHLQVFIGNDLMLFSILCIFLVAFFDGFTTLEHPQSPSQYGDHRPHASIWHTAVIEWLLATNLFTLLMVNQGHFHAKSTKPTSLLMSGVQSATLVHMERTMRTSSLPLKGSIGCDEHGWRTSSLKEYTEQFNGFLAKCFQVWLHMRQDCPSEDVYVDQEWLKDLCIALSTCPSAQKYGPDFFQEGRM